VKKATVAAVALIWASAPSAQDRTLTVRESGVVLVGAEVRFVPDGGCAFIALAANDAGVDVVPAAYPFNGARCTTVRNAALKAANLDLQVGDGTQP
jgi:hypothetical protein